MSTPPRLIVLLKKSFAGLTASLSTVALSCSESPVVERSPSYATTPSCVRTGPLVGVTKPLTGIETVEPALVTWAKPSYTTMFRAGSPGSS